MASEFTFYKRKNKKNQNIYYAGFRDPDSGSRSTAISTGCTSKGAAQEWAIDYLALDR
jgi:hypothetical protein